MGSAPLSSPAINSQHINIRDHCKAQCRGAVVIGALSLALNSSDLPLLERTSTVLLALQYGYTFLGWIILSLATLTFTGTLKERLN